MDSGEHIHAFIVRAKRQITLPVRSHKPCLSHIGDPFPSQSTGCLHVLPYYSVDNLHGAWARTLKVASIRTEWFHPVTSHDLYLDGGFIL